MEDSKTIVLKAQIGIDAGAVESIAQVDFCVDNVAVTVKGQSVFIPWSEIISWPQWLAENIEE